MKKEPLKPSDPGYWEWRGRTGFRGQPKQFKDANHLWRLACDYFRRIDENPFKRQEQRKAPVRIGKDTVISEDLMKEIMSPVIELETIRPYTWSGFTDYIFEQGFGTTLQDYRANRNGAYEEYVAVVRAIDEVMFTQKFSGAAVGAFNSNIIARDLGLADKIHQTVTEQPLFGNDDKEEE